LKKKISVNYSLFFFLEKKVKKQFFFILKFPKITTIAYNMKGCFIFWICPNLVKYTYRVWSLEQHHKIERKQGVCHTMALPVTLKSILRQKKNHGNSNISPCKNIIFKQSSKGIQNPSKYYDSVTYLKFQHKSNYHLSKILI
jgi:hypothetical protein